MVFDSLPYPPLPLMAPQGLWTAPEEEWARWKSSLSSLAKIGTKFAHRAWVTWRSTNTAFHSNNENFKDDWKPLIAVQIQWFGKIEAVLQPFCLDKIALYDTTGSGGFLTDDNTVLDKGPR